MAVLPSRLLTIDFGAGRLYPIQPDYDRLVDCLTAASNVSPPYPFFGFAFNHMYHNRRDGMQEVHNIGLRLRQLDNVWCGWGYMLRELYIQMRKLHFVQLHEAGLSAVFANAFLDFHKERNSVRLPRSQRYWALKCTVPLRQWRHMHEHRELFASEWLSVQKPDQELLEYRKAHKGTLQGPSLRGLQFPHARQAICDAFRTNHPSVMYMFKLWALRSREDVAPFTLYELRPSAGRRWLLSQQRANNRAALFKVPPELMLYIMNAVWIEALLCPCWNNDYQRYCNIVYRSSDPSWLV
jgi:hypothetical protein